MMKFITTIGAFSLTFILSVALVGFPKTNYFPFETVNNYRIQQNISSLLTQDISNGRERDRKIYSLDDTDFSSDSVYLSPEYAETISEYVNESSSIDDSDLPTDFQLAWQNHLRAWREHANFLSKPKSHCKMQKFNSEEFSRTFARQDEEITVTWRKVLSVAGKYGATVSYRYY
ncbi:MAG: hypothetical protein ACR2MG_18385 [Pyrinomonadaceae bacterium]|jgi:hypothetical protein